MSLPTPKTVEDDEPEASDLGETTHRVFVELEPLCDEYRRRVLSAVAVLLGLEE